MYTIDASVHISALNPREADCSTSRAFLELLRERRSVLFSPTLLLVEVTAGILLLSSLVPDLLLGNRLLDAVPHQAVHEGLGLFIVQVRVAGPYLLAQRFQPAQGLFPPSFFARLSR